MTHEIDVKNVSRRELTTWLMLNGLSPSDIPEGTSLWVEEGPDGEWGIRCTVLLRNEEGRRYLVPKTYRLAEAEIVQPLLFDPPMQWLKPVTA